MRNKILIAILLLAGYIFWGTNALEVNHITITDEEIPSEFSGMKIAHVSDLHNKDFGNALFEKVSKEQPDLIAVTGDLIDGNFPDTDVALETIEKLCEIAPVYYVTGNHEASRFDLYSELALEMEAAGVKLMDNQELSLERKGQTIHMIGLEDPNFINSALSFEAKYQQMHSELARLSNSSDYQILLSHRPEEMASYVEEEIDLVLSGHAHGGQIRLPFIGAIVAPGQGFFPKYSVGAYTEKGRKSWAW